MYRLLGIVAVLLIGLAAASHAGEFRAFVGEGGTGLTSPREDSGYQPIAPVESSMWTNSNSSPVTWNSGNDQIGICVDQADPGHWGGCIFGGAGAYMAHVLANGTEMELCQGTRPSGGSTGSCWLGGYSVGEIRFLATFSCHEQTGAIPVSLNFIARGYANFQPLAGTAYNPDCTEVTLRVKTGLETSGYDGIWAAENTRAVSTGIFAGSTGNTLDGAFTGEEFMVPLNEPVTIVLRAELYIFSNLCSFSGDAGVVRGHFSDGVEEGRGIYLPREGAPIFNLPGDCHVFAEDICIVDNELVVPPPGEPCSSMPAESNTWGKVKALYRP